MTANALMAQGQNGKASIRFHLTDSKGEPVPYGTIRLSDSLYVASTDANGEAEMKDVPLGAYKVHIHAFGFEKISEEIKVHKDLHDLKYTLTAASNQLNEVVLSGSSKPTYRTFTRSDIDPELVPVTISSVDKEMIQQRNVDELGEALKSVTGIRPMNTYGGFQTFTIRGFNNFVLMVDGVRDERHNISTSAPSTNLANVERIEVLKGPASVLFGHSALGGVINISRKQPGRTLSGGLAGTIGSFNTMRLQAGVGGPVNDKLRYRIDLGRSQTDGFRGEGFQTNNAYIALDYQPGSRDFFQIRVQANRDHYNTDTGLPVLQDGSLAPLMDRRTRYNDPRDYLINTRKDYQLRYEHTFKNGITISDQVSYYDDNIKYLSTEELVFNASMDSLTRNFPLHFNHETKPFQNQLEATGSFRTGGIEQKLLAGYSLSIMDRKTFRGNVSGPGFRSTISVVDPDLDQGPIKVTEHSYIARMENVHGFYLQDWVDLSKRLKALVGIRYDIFSGTYYTDQIEADRSITTKGDRDDFTIRAFTWRAGLVYQVREDLNVYGSYSTYFKPTRRLSVDGKIFDPEDGYQAELGTRLSFLRIFTSTFSLFHMVRTNVLETVSAGVFRNIGEAESNGLEWDVEAKLSSALHVRAGYAFTVARVREHKDKAVENPRAGNTLPYAPRHAFNSWIVYALPAPVKGLSLGGGVFAQGSNYTNAANTYSLPAYTIVDAFIAYTRGGSELRLNVNNLTDTYYFNNAIMGNQWMVGNPRNYTVSFRHSF